MAESAPPLSDREATYPGLLPLEEVETFVRTHGHLPRISREAVGLFERADITLEKIEELYLYLFDLHARLTRLELARDT
ncbi:MAG: hypothetical protein A3E78_08195 [Alphaproteobacteria bacterium RIFCSPHIGHO2_12_FULL_63_12]|nr:MAG: hypothetical protein A3E78_08195 [Alphaproteobacteria bacterium RIFCSPHIGHO2_12_FULL_63_12]